jgi:inorganic pyrophosphatase
MPSPRSGSCAQLPSFDDDDLTTVVEAIRGSRSKFKYDERRRVFALDSVLPAGATYPFDFGFVPSTRGQDGDPIDVLILMDEPAFVGAIVPARLVGAIQAEQTEENGKTVRNDRLIAIACTSHTYRGMSSLESLPPNLVDEIEHFWISYNQIKGVAFRPIGRVGARGARQLVLSAKRSRSRRSSKRT